MALHGTIEAFGLDEALRLLADTRQTGHLRVRGDGGEGQAWLRGGAVAAAVSARVADGPPVEVLADLLGYRTGSFAFDPAPPAVLATAAPEGLPVHDLLADATALRTEWDALMQVCPSLDLEAHLLPQLPDPQVTIEAGLWPAIVALASPRTVNELAALFDLGELDALRLVARLGELGLIALAPASAPANGAAPAPPPA